jgi:hypothetical protein
MGRRTAVQPAAGEGGKKEMIKVLVSDALGDAGIQIFRETAGIDVDVKTGLSPQALKGDNR